MVAVVSLAVAAVAVVGVAGNLSLFDLYYNNDEFIHTSITKCR